MLFFLLLFIIGEAMKKIILLLLFIPLNVFAMDTVSLVRCVDGDTAVFMVNGEEQSVRFLAIDTPELGEGYYAEEAASFTCSELENAKEICLEYDDNSDLYDKYDRLLAHVFVDGLLLQDKLVRNGYAEVAYLYGDYKYTSKLEISEEVAKVNGRGIWSSGRSYYIYEIIVLVLVVAYTVYKKLKR